MHKIADGVVRRAEEIAIVECMDTGQSLNFMAKAALRGAENFRFFADLASQARDGQSLRGPSQLNVTSRVPIGPVGVITPWNTPFMLSTWKIAPALAAGCTLVHKPAEFSPLTARLLVEIAEEAGLPPGVWNLVNGLGEDAGKALTEHPDIKAIGFVGESRTGSMIMRQGAETLKRLHFELGGKNPIIVFADADLDRAADAAVFMIYSLNGERCTSSSRLLVESAAEGALKTLADAGQAGGLDFAFEDIRFEPPIPAPEKIICVGVNYPDRNEEYRDAQPAPAYPSLFVRFPGSFVGHDAPLVRPSVSNQLDYEGEVALIIGKAGRHISEARALDHVAAVTLANDGSVRDWIRHGKFNVMQGKNFDNSGSLGPWLIPFVEDAQIADIELTTRVNGEVRQKDRTSRMIFPFRRLLAYISTFTTLTPGDIILTGTPTGSGARLDPPKYLVPGDVVEIEAGGLGVLSNGIVDEARA